MSGPKSFSVHVFDKRLKKIFVLQSQINQVFQELQCFSVDDAALNISFDCDDFIDKNNDLVAEELKTFELGYKGTVQQDVHDKIEKRLESKIKQLETLQKKITEKKNDFLSKRQDYLSYVSYNKYYENAHQSFDGFKINLTSYLEKNIKKENPELFEKSENEIKQIQPSIKKIKFDFGFQKIEQQSKQKVEQHINEKENLASDIRNEIAKDMLAKSLSQGKPSIKAEPQKEDKELVKLLAKINDKIDAIEDDKQRKKAQKDLNKLKKSEVLVDSYFYKEFLDRLNELEKTQHYKNKIRDLVFEINSLQVADNLLSKKNEIQQYAVELLESEMVKDYKIEDFKTKCHFFKEENKESIESEFIRQKENEFLKAQLVNGLKSMNYEVMDDMQVIDFEKQSDFIFKVPHQKNYVNLRIDNNNNIAYNFLMEENKDELSIEEKRKKVIEMESTCKTFKEVLKDLESMGLKIDQTKTNESDIDKLMQVPEKYRSKIKKAEEEQRRAQEQVEKKKYLDG